MKFFFKIALLISISMGPACSQQPNDNLSNTSPQGEPGKASDSIGGTLPSTKLKWLPPVVFGTVLTGTGLCTLSYFAAWGPCKQRRAEVAIDVKQVDRSRFQTALQSWSSEMNHFNLISSERVKAFQHITDLIENAKLPMRSGTKTQLWMASRHDTNILDGILITEKIFKKNKLYLHIRDVTTAPWNTPGYNGNLHPPIKLVGTALMREALQFAKANGFSGLFGNPIQDARRFYIRIAEDNHLSLIKEEDELGNMYMYLDFQDTAPPIKQPKQAIAFLAPTTDDDWKRAWREAFGQAKDPSSHKIVFKNAPDQAYIEYLLNTSNSKSPDAVGVDVNILDSAGENVLSWAINTHKKRLFTTLVKVPGINPNILDTDGNTPLIKAATNGYLDAVKALLSITTIEVNKINNKRWTALIVASFRPDNQEVIQALSKNPKLNLNPNIRDTDGDTALMMACHYRKKYGGNIANINALLQTPHINVNIPNGAGQNPLLQATIAGDTELMQMLSNANGIDPNVQAPNGDTPLMIAAAKKHIEAINILKTISTIAEGINTQNQRKYTALIMASLRENNEDVIDALSLIPDLNPNLGDADGDTALILAAMSGFTTNVQALLQIGLINVNIPNQAGQTPWQVAKTVAIREMIENHHSYKSSF